jgi:hypothetical protein
MDPAPLPIEQNLFVCYRAIFGLTDIRSGTLSRLTQWPRFLAAHATRDPAVHRNDNAWWVWRPIVSLSDFMWEYRYVLAAFEHYNFLEEYWQLFGHTPGYRQDHVTADTAKGLLQLLFEKISMDGALRVHQRIGGLIATHGTPNRELDNQIWRWLQDNPDRPPVRSDSLWNADPTYKPPQQPPAEGTENADPQSARLPALLQQLLLVSV